MTFDNIPQTRYFSKTATLLLTRLNESLTGVTSEIDFDLYEFLKSHRGKLH